MRIYNLTGNKTLWCTLSQDLRYPLRTCFQVRDVKNGWERTYHLIFIGL